MVKVAEERFVVTEMAPVLGAAAPRKTMPFKFVPRPPEPLGTKVLMKAPDVPSKRRMLALLELAAYNVPSGPKARAATVSRSGLVANTLSNVPVEPLYRLT